MKKPLLSVLILYSSFIQAQADVKNWIVVQESGYTLHYTTIDSKNKNEYNELIKNGISSIHFFFDMKYKKGFDVFFHPNRKSLDSTWQKDWQMPQFRSECWMVASGIDTKLDVISPKMWDKESCEHIYTETKKTQQLITHELVHVFHGQLNKSPDFSNVEGIDWFVEGLATYASSQLDSTRLTEIKKAIADKNTPNTLDKFWAGKLKYGLAGSIVKYIDYKFGRNKLKELLSLTKKSEMLTTLNISEKELLTNWSAYMQNLKID